MNILRCDTCNDTTSADQPRPSWLVVQRLSVVYTVDEHQGPYHFCSETCIAVYFARKAQVSVDGRAHTTIVKD